MDILAYDTTVHGFDVADYINWRTAPMPKNSKVGKCYDKLTKAGRSKGSAAAICQDATGQSLATGRKPKKKAKK